MSPGFETLAPAAGTRLLVAPLAILYRHRELIVALARRDIAARYRGSLGGIAWALLTPLALLAVYATVFGVILQARWARTESTAEFALILYAGLLLFAVFQEGLTRGPNSIRQQPNLVRKVVFPLEAIAWVHVLSTLFHFCVGLIVLIAFQVALKAAVPLTFVALPLVLLPAVLMALGALWLLGALGVFLRDLEQIVGPLSLALLFLAPVFYDLSLVPEGMRWLYALNPMTFVIEQGRAVMLGGQWPDLAQVAVAAFGAYIFALLSLAFFRKARPDFADAL